MSLFDFSRYSLWKVLIPKFKTKSNVPRYIELAQFHRHTMHSSFCIHSPDVNWPPQILTGVCCDRPGYIREQHQPNFPPSVEVICRRDVMLCQPCSSHYEFIPVILKLNHSDVIGSHSYETTVFFLLKHHTTQKLAFCFSDINFSSIMRFNWEIISIINCVLSFPFLKWKSLSLVSNSLRPPGLYSPWNSSGQNTGVGSLSLLQGLFPTQGSNPGLPHHRQIL